MTKTVMTPKRKRGRPRGSKTRSVVVASFAMSCPTCGSTERTDYYDTRSREAPGEFEGRRYDRIVYRRCRCLKCNQLRIERTFEVINAAGFLTKKEGNGVNR